MTDVMILNVIDIRAFIILHSYLFISTFVVIACGSTEPSWLYVFSSVLSRGLTVSLVVNGSGVGVFGYVDSFQY